MLLQNAEYCIELRRREDVWPTLFWIVRRANVVIVVHVLTPAVDAGGADAGNANGKEAKGGVS